MKKKKGKKFKGLFVNVWKKMWKSETFGHIWKIVEKRDWVYSQNWWKMKKWKSPGTPCKKVEENVKMWKIGVYLQSLIKKYEKWEGRGSRCINCEKLWKMKKLRSSVQK